MLSFVPMNLPTSLPGVSLLLVSPETRYSSWILIYRKWTITHTYWPREGKHSFNRPLSIHKVQSSTLDTEVGKNFPARILYLQKGKKTRKLFMFLAAIMLANPVHPSIWRLGRFFHNCINCFTSLSFQERPRDFGRETSSHLEIYARKPLAYMN